LNIEKKWHDNNSLSFDGIKQEEDSFRTIGVNFQVVVAGESIS
jgi:hypothetical protein